MSFTIFISNDASSDKKYDDGFHKLGAWDGRQEGAVETSGQQAREAGPVGTGCPPAAHACWLPAGGAELALLSTHSERESSRAWASALAFLCQDPRPASDQSAGPRRGWASPPPGPLRTQEVRPPPETMTKAGLRGRLVLRLSSLSHPPRLGAAQLTAPAEAARSRLPSSPPRPGTGAGALCGHLLGCG